MKIAAIVLAAGTSSRMLGGHKLLLPFGNSSVIGTVVDHLLTGIRASTDSVIVVTGFQHEEVVRYLNGRPVRFVHNRRFIRGLAGSIRCGIEACDPEISGYMIAHGDMPAISAGTYRLLLDAFLAASGEQICYPVCAGRQANPVIFPRKMRELLLSITGDRGAKSILNDSSIGKRAVECPQEVLLDIDTRHDLEMISGSDRSDSQEK